jgi:aryl-alcohol dehydrogenase-like predicted oxidoreductase
MTSVLIGATTMEQLRTNLASATVNLSQEVIQDIEAVHRSYPNPCP